MALALSRQPSRVTVRPGTLCGGRWSRYGEALTGLLGPIMRSHELMIAGVDAHGLESAAEHQFLAHKAVWRRVVGLLEVDVAVAKELHRLPDPQVVPGIREGQHRLLLDRLEDLQRLLVSRAVITLSGDVRHHSSSFSLSTVVASTSRPARKLRFT